MRAPTFFVPEFVAPPEVVPREHSNQNRYQYDKSTGLFQERGWHFFA